MDKKSKIQDKLIFNRVMEMNPELFQHLIETILNSKITRMKYREKDKDIEDRLDKRGILVEIDVENRKIDLEIQIVDEPEVGMLIRYYQSLIDVDNLEHGIIDRDTCIICICSFDPYDRGEIVYDFKLRCRENPKLVWDDGTQKIVLNATGTVGDVNPELKSFLEYVDSGKISSEFVQKINDAVEKID